MTTRRALGLGAACAGLVLALAGCGTQPPVVAPQRTAPPATTGTPAAPAAPATSAAVSPAVEPSDSAPPPMNDAAPTAISGYLAITSEKRLFFGHQSVGFDVMRAINRLSREHGYGTPRYIDIGKHEPVPTDPGVGFIARTKIGTNGKALTKIAAFDKLLRGGLADKLDVAFFKLCFVDIDADTNVKAIFTKYKSVLAALEADFPGLAFIHATVPLEVDAAGANTNRTKLNEMLRNEYGDTGRLWDIAMVESTDPDGNRVGGKRYEALFPGYASDGAHLNDGGGAVVAAALLKVVAHAGATR